MKVFIVALGSFGDVNPFICLAKELQRRDHEVVLLVSAEAIAKVKRNGIAAHPIMTQEQYDTWRNMPRSDDPDDENGKALLHMALPAVDETIKYVWQNFKPGKSLGITMTMQGLGLKFLELRLSLPVIRVDLAPRDWHGDDADEAARKFNEHFADPFDKLGQALGLSKNQKGWYQTLITDKYTVGLYPKWFVNQANERIASDANLEESHFLFDEDDDSQPLPDKLIEFLNHDDAPLAVTFGTYASTDDNLYRTVVEACGRLGKRAVLITKYPQQLPNPLPDYCLHVEYVNLKLLFPRLSCIIHHGGVGTSAQAFRAGLPQLICPMAFDQFFNADSIEILGCGSQIKATDFNPDGLTASLSALLNNQNIKNQAQQQMASFPKYNPAIWSCDLIEKYAQRLGVLDND